MNPEALSELISRIAYDLVAAGEAGTLTEDLIPPVEKFAVMRPKDRSHGDWASNAAMQLAKKAGMKPRDLAELFAARLQSADGVAAVEVAGPGFINITLDSASAAAVVDAVLEQGAQFGRNNHLSGQTLNLEFVSANPTGPIHIGGTRWAAVGDSMARVLEANGAKVVREYYFNDHGEQINRFAKSLVAAAHGEQTPADGYKGAYIDEIAQRVIDEAKADGIDTFSMNFDVYGFVWDFVTRSGRKEQVRFATNGTRFSNLLGNTEDLTQIYLGDAYWQDEETLVVHGRWVETCIEDTYLFKVKGDELSVVPDNNSAFKFFKPEPIVIEKLNELGRAWFAGAPKTQALTLLEEYIFCGGVYGLPVESHLPSYTMSALPGYITKRDSAESTENGISTTPPVSRSTLKPRGISILLPPM